MPGKGTGKQYQLGTDIYAIRVQQFECYLLACRLVHNLEPYGQSVVKLHKNSL